MNVALHHIRRVLNKFLLDGARDRKDAMAMETLAPLSLGYLPWSQASMRPSGLVAVLNDIVINQRSYIVECGSGVSTFYIARLLKERGGRLHTIEHDERWADLLEKALAKEELSEYATVVFAPLADTRHSWDGAKWYDESKLKRITDSGKIDLLLVDGPPAYGKELMHARYPAVPVFKPYLADDYTVVLDDINRQGEQEIVKRWERELGVKFSLRFLDGTIAMGRPRGSFSV